MAARSEVKEGEVCGAAGLLSAPHTPQAERLSRRRNRPCLRALQQITIHPPGSCLIAAHLLLHDPYHSCSGGYTSQKLMVAWSPVPSADVFSGEGDVGRLHPRGANPLCGLSTRN